MKIVYEYSHLGGSEILQVKYPEIDQEINSVISSVTATRDKESFEKTKHGKMLYGPKSMNSQFLEGFRGKGFIEKRDYYTIKIPDYNLEIYNAYKQVDFVKDRVFVEVQFGKYAFMFYDMAKFQYFFNESHADVGVEIVPCHSLHKKMSSGVSYGEQLVYDIERLKRHFPAVSVKIIFIDIDEDKN